MTPIRLCLLAFVLLLVAVPEPAPAQGRASGLLLGPRKASDLVVLTLFNGSLQACTDFTQRVLPDGTTVPFAVPAGRVLVLQTLNFETAVPIADNLFLIVRQGGSSGASVLLVPLITGPSVAGGSVPVPGVVVGAGSSVCIGRNAAGFTFAQLHGFLADDE